MARKEDVFLKLQSLLPKDAFSFDEAYQTGVICSVQAPLEKLREVASGFNEAGFYLESITGLDFQDTQEVVYHFNCYEPKSRITVRILCDEDQRPPTLSDMFLSAAWQEREVHDFFGIRFANHPDLRPLLLPEDSYFHPLKKSFGNVIAYRKREEIYA